MVIIAINMTSAFRETSLTSEFADFETLKKVATSPKSLISLLSFYLRRAVFSLKYYATICNFTYLISLTEHGGKMAPLSQDEARRRRTGRIIVELFSCPCIPE